MTSTPSPNCNIITALNCEARPLIDHYKLKRQHDLSAFETYANEEKNIHLVICGIGKINAAAATTFIQMLSGNSSRAVFLNVGIAGARDLAINDLVVANKVLAQLNPKQVHYPFARYLKGIKPYSLLCCDAPQADYPDQMMVDMESLGFFEAALKFVAQEQIHVLKVISDNKDNSWENITAKSVSASIQSQIKNITDAVDSLLLLSKNEINATHIETEIDAFLARWHFSFYQQKELTKLLRSWAVNNENSALEFCQQAADGAGVIKILTEAKA